MNKFSKELLGAYGRIVSKAIANKDYKKSTLALGRILVATDDITTIEQKEIFMNMYLNSLKLTTYKEFMEIYPIEKRYDGDKWETKDYFYTKKYMESIDLDELIGDDDTAIDLAFSYANDELLEIFPTLMCTMSAIMRKEKGIGIAEAFVYGDTYQHDSKGNIITTTPDGKIHKTVDPHSPRNRFTVVK